MWLNIFILLEELLIVQVTLIFKKKNQGGKLHSNTNEQRALIASPTSVDRNVALSTFSPDHSTKSCPITPVTESPHSVPFIQSALILAYFFHMSTCTFSFILPAHFPSNHLFTLLLSSNFSTIRVHFSLNKHFSNFHNFLFKVQVRLIQNLMCTWYFVIISSSPSILDSCRTE